MTGLDEIDSNSSLKSSIKKYINSFKNGAKFMCNQCNYKSKQASNLNHHKKIVHDGIKYKCEHCDYKYSSKAGLILH